MARLARMSLLTKILLATSIAITLLFAVTGWVVQNQFLRSASQTLDDEVHGSFTAYESLWRARAAQLASVSLVLSRMPDVRAAFSTADQATIRDTAGEIWNTISAEGAIFLVADPRGHVLASLGGVAGADLQELDLVRRAAVRFPAQATGFLDYGAQLYQTVVTPVHVTTARGPALLTVLVAGFAVDADLARQLKRATGGSDFVFCAQGRVVAASLALSGSCAGLGTRLADSGFTIFSTPLPDIDARPFGELHILRSSAAAQARIAALRRNMALAWLLAVVAGLALTALLARRILQPVGELSRAAAAISRGDFGARAQVGGEDELGRLAQTFNHMAESLGRARQELIRQEQIATIGRLSTSIIHDLRNPLASIYGGSEMLVDGDLAPPQVRRLAANIYSSSRRMQKMLGDLADLTRGRTQAPEPCSLWDVADAARQMLQPAAESRGIRIQIDVPPEIVLPVERSRLERVFDNLFANAVNAMPAGGELRVTAWQALDMVEAAVEDSGPGVAPAIAERLFQPFVTTRKGGMGLGLALSRQTLLDHGGDLWLDASCATGARFRLRLPLNLQEVHTR